MSLSVSRSPQRRLETGVRTLRTRPTGRRCLRRPRAVQTVEEVSCFTLSGPDSTRGLMDAVSAISVLMFTGIKLHIVQVSWNC